MNMLGVICSSIALLLNGFLLGYLIGLDTKKK